jgi:outer membrane protein assembly factor BamB
VEVTAMVGKVSRPARALAVAAVGLIIATGCTAGRASPSARPTPPGTGAVGPPSGSVEHDAGPVVSLRWYRAYRGVTAQSSPAPITVDGRRAIVVGSRGGQLHAFFLDDGAVVPGWPVSTPGDQPVDSTPSVDGDLIFVGTGDAARPDGGGYLALHDDGTTAWYRRISELPATTRPYAGVAASMAVGILEGPGLSVVAGSLGQQEDELDATDGAVRAGFPWYSSDTEFSTPAVADLYGDGRDEIIEGAEQTAGVSFGHRYTQGGHFRVLAASGNAGTGRPGGGVICDDTPDQGVYSSPAVGRFLAGGTVGMVAGTSTDFAGASATGEVIALDTHCRAAWTASLDGSTQSSPSLVDALGTGALEVAEGTARSAASGTVYLLDGATGRILWQRALGGSVIGGIGSADLGRADGGAGYQDLIVPTTGGAYVLDGRTGAILDRLGDGRLGEQNAPLVTDDADGTIGITLAGYNAAGGAVAHFEVTGTDGRRADEAGAWPEFHHDPQLTGSTLPRAT